MPDAGKTSFASRGFGASGDFVACDVTDDESVERAVQTVVERHGRLDVAVNAAGTGSGGSVMKLEPSEFQTTVETNLTGVFRSIRAEARAMKASGGGSIVNISSIAVRSRTVG